MISQPAYQVLVAEGGAENTAVLRDLLTPAGYAVRVATDGDSALQGALQSPPDLILLAVSLPGMDAYVVCRRLKEIEATRHIPVIFVSNRNDSLAEAQCFAMGGADYITQPFQLPVLLARIRAQLAIHQRQRNLEGMFRDVMEFSPDALIVSDLPGCIVRVNAQAEVLSGYGREELVGQPLAVLLPERFRSEHVAQHAAFSTAPGARRMGAGRTVRFLRKDASECEVEVSLNQIQTAHGTLFVSALRDVGLRRKAEDQLRIAAIAFESQEGMVVTDATGAILQVNAAFTTITGYSAEELRGQSTRLLQSGKHSADFYRLMWDTLLKTGRWQGEVWGKRKNEEIYLKRLTISAVKGDDGIVTHYVGSESDITEHKQAQEKINELAFYDQLTGLPNRTLLIDRLRQVKKLTERSGSYNALLFIDLDHFKNLNSTLGHDVGDLLLKQVAKRIGQCVREGDTVARLGGDEFVVVLANLSHNLAEAGTHTEMVATKIIATLDQMYHFGNASHHSTASMGATLFKGTQTSIEDLLKQTDLTMYRAKALGRNTFRFFDPAIEAALKARTALEADLRRAVDSRQFTLHYQAQVVQPGHVTGAEVLVRWRHPERGMVSPADFIPLAEETGVILALGLWVLETACSQLETWGRTPAMAHLTIAVNVSALQFAQPDFVEQVMTAVQRTGANPLRLKLELTESLLVGNVSDIIAKMLSLKDHGIGLSLDDFGTGYSSLAYLSRLPLDQLKIDQSFVSDVLTSPGNAAIARTIIAMAQGLGLGVIAEGVETDAQREFLAASGCHAYQGYFFSRPLPLEGFEALVCLPHRTKDDVAATG
jgi:diguanylate cyclase (GGDEF)-like protein/PAS domain S-box-containing protein